MCAKKIATIQIFELSPSLPSEEGTRPLREQSWLWLPKGPGFGIDIPEDWLREV